MNHMALISVCSYHINMSLILVRPPDNIFPVNAKLSYQQTARCYVSIICLQLQHCMINHI